MRSEILQPELFSSIETRGYHVVNDAVDHSTVAGLIDYFQTTINSQSTIDRNGSTFAIRNLLRDHAIVRQLTDSPSMRAMVNPILGPTAIAVRGILFDKTPRANWKVPWHQDLSIAVKERIELAGYGPWSVKAGVPHVQPPAGVLENMLTLRLHLDDCGMDNGPLLVLTGSHEFGVLCAKQVSDFRVRGTHKQTLFQQRLRASHRCFI